MRRVILYEYDKRNREIILKRLIDDNYEFLPVFINDLQTVADRIQKDAEGYIFDVTSVFISEERSFLYASVIEKLIDCVQDDWPVYFIIDKRYSYGFTEMLFYRLENIESFEEKVGLKMPCNNDIVSLDEKEFENLLNVIQNELIGHEKFKQLLGRELRRYRVFNKLGYQPIFSIFLLGNSGIGKTEVARIIARTLSPEEPFIKINFGNYSAHNALSSLIGSPRGYIGSSRGELSEKLSNSRSKVILIDEFEKCDKQVQNFFLQLLEDGVFTDSLGRDYNLDKYIIVFTSNLSKTKVATHISPELWSRFNMPYSFTVLQDEEKKEYIEKRT